MTADQRPASDTADEMIRPNGAPSDHGLTGEAMAVPSTVRRRRRSRRPTGAPPPLPRSIGATGKSWLIVLGVSVIWLLVALKSNWAARATERSDTVILRAIAHFRAGWLTHVMKAIDGVLSGWTTSIVAYGVIAALIFFRRWRHLFTFVVSVFVIKLLGQVLYDASARPRPYDVTIIGNWRGYAMPSVPVAVFTIVDVSIIYSMVVPGRPRSIAKA